MQKTIFSTADVATLFNVTETTVKRWTDEGLLKCQKTPGGHRKFDTKHIAEFADTFGFSPTGTLTPGDESERGTELQAAVLSRNFEAIAAAFVQRGLADEGPDLPDLLSYLYQHNLQLWEIFDLVIRPGMIRVGQGWKKGEIGIGAEHRISQRTLEALAQLKTQVHMKPANGLTALCACPEDTIHEIGLRCASLVLEGEGWKVHYLGGNTPLESLLEFQNRIRPSLICLSISAIDIERPITLRLRRLFRAVSERNANLVIGGPVGLEEHIGRGECHKLLHSCLDLLEFVGSRNEASVTATSRAKK